MKPDIVKVGNTIYGKYKSGFAGNVVDSNGVCYTISAMGGGNREPHILIIDETQ